MAIPIIKKIMVKIVVIPLIMLIMVQTMNAAQGDVTINEYPTEVNWALDKELFEKIANNLAEFQNDPILMAFYNAQLAQTLGQLNESDEKTSEVEKASTMTEALWEAKKIAVAAAESEIAAKDAELEYALTAEDSVEILEEKKPLYEDLAVKMQDAIEADETKEIETDLKAAQGITYTDQIGTNRLQESNLKVVNTIFLETVGKRNYTFTEEQWNMVDNIAQQCPISGGPGVYKARSLYALKADRNYSDEGNCLSQGVLLRESIEKDLTLTVLPNPNDGNFLVQWDKPLKEDEKGVLTIINVLGKTLLTQVVEGENNYTYLSVGDLPNGIYYCKLSIENAGIYTCKIVIAH